MKILFVNLPYKFDISRTSRWPEKTKSATLYYPYWLAYATGVCQDKGHTVKLVDCIASKYSINDLKDTIREFQPDFLVTEVTTSTCMEDYVALDAIKKESPELKIIVGGTHATALPEHVLENCNSVDIVARKEYDFTIEEIVSGNTPHEAIQGISYKKDGVTFHNDDREYIENLDVLPFASKIYQQFLNVDDYGYSLAQKPMVQIFSARGCPYHCNFCSYPETMGGRAFRKRSVKNFVDEIEYICLNMPEIKEIFIEDDTFTVDKQRVIDICNEMMRRNLKPIWSCNSRADLPYDVMKKMKEAGCRLLVTGFESGNQEVLNKIKKGITLKQSLEFAENARKLKLKIFGCFMIGLTGDSLDTILETYHFAKKINVDMVFFQQAVPFPGTGFYDWVKENNYISTEDYGKWLNEEGYLNCLVNYPYASSQEIERLRDKLMGKYYFSPGYIFKTFINNLSWLELKRIMKAGLAYSTFRIRKLIKG